MAKNSNNTKTTIELNGKLYDARSGHLVVADVAAQPASPGSQVITPAAPQTNPVITANTTASPASTTTPGRNVDGFFRAANAQTLLSTNKPVSIRPASVSQPLEMPRPIRNSNISSIQKRPVEKSHTLMRSSVSRPVADLPVTSDSAKKATEATSKLGPASGSGSATIAVEPPSTSIANQGSKLQSRLQRASQVPRSSAVKRFSFEHGSPVNKRVEHLPVQPHPDADSSSQNLVSSQQPARPSAQAFARELQQATSHRQPKAAKAGAKAVKLSMAGLVVIALGGFVAYHNMPGMSLHLADAKAGISASMPSYTPSGFRLSRNIEAIPGQVTANFVSNSDNRSYKVSQTQSDWNSSNLLEAYVKPTYKNYQTLQSAGKTIYFDGKSNATWVSNGLWYQVNSQANLSSHQLLSIINSL